MMTEASSSPGSGGGTAHGPLARSLVKLAGTPDDASDLDDQLVAIAQLAAENLAAVSYASTTVLRDDAYTTVAATSALATAVDEAQYADGDGPCLEALDSGRPVSVPDMATTMRWPGFRETARGLGLHASLSVPLFAGRGDAVASMNLYGRDAIAMTDLSLRVKAAFHTPDPAHRPEATGADDLADGLARALAVRDRIQLAVGMLAERTRCSMADAYLSLRVHAADAGIPLPDMASRTLQQRS
ncbi:GAF and ANTAR domain-containing protein [Cryptosporangium sp. NPDC048952]|uniref:GAF and ANTAR domain-containing protein n=1 Tax=Cryptosporangium sp. NPDC048952 TaxID=3363961 RepID=UPI0037126F6D